MKILDLTPEFIKTVMMTQRVILFPNGYGLSITGGPYVCGDGKNTFDVSIIKHKLNTNVDIDYFALDFTKYSEDDLKFDFVYSEELGIESWFYVDKDKVDDIADKVRHLKN